MGADTGVITIYTDGGAQGNPGPGGFGVILEWKGKKKSISKAYRLTTNNRMELLAVITGLEALTKSDIPVVIVSDSKYVVDAVEKKWVFGWEKKGFAGKKNPDLWMKFLDLYEVYKPRFRWIKGHAGHPQNEACDRMAVAAAINGPHEVDTFYENLPKEAKS